MFQESNNGESPKKLQVADVDSWETFQDSQRWGWSDCDDTAKNSDLTSTTTVSDDSQESLVTPKKGKSDSGERVSTPRSAITIDKNCHIRGRRLHFPGDESKCTFRTTNHKDVIQIDGWELCSSGKIQIKLDVRLPIKDEWSLESMNAGFEEVVATVYDGIPDEALSYVLKRRAAVLPVKCDVCSHWRPPLYRCKFCGLLKTGIDLYNHESECETNRV